MFMVKHQRDEIPRCARNRLRNLVNSSTCIEGDCLSAVRTRTRLPAPEAQLVAGRSLAMTPMLTFCELINTPSLHVEERTMNGRAIVSDHA